MHRIQAHITLAIMFIVVITILYMPIMVKLKRKGVRTIKQFGYLGLICSLFLIVFATIFFVPITLHPKQHILNLAPFNWVWEEENVINHLIVEIIPNIMLFIPVGIFIPTVYKKKSTFLKNLKIVLIITASVEFIQYFIGRSCDIIHAI